MASTLVLEIKMSWWWKWLYWPLTRFGMWLGLPLNPEVIIADTLKAIKFKRVRGT